MALIGPEAARTSDDPSLIGRDAEVALITRRLTDRRVVTLVGPGGIGKTTLAHAVAARCEGSYGEGARVVDLTRVDSAPAVRESLAGQLGYQSFPAMLDAPADHSVLLVIDNCEHVVDAVADAIERLLASCELPTVLATSRRALEVAGEAVVPIGPLELPPPGALDGPAVRLFIERAIDGGSLIEPSDAVAELCRRLDGVPLAIELAAARTRAMAPEEILDRLTTGLDVLDRPRRRSARRHQSLRAAIAWSYDLLDDDERTLFDGLGVFPGPFTAAMAHAVAGSAGAPASETQDRLDGLVAACMVVADPTASPTWYRELETLRAFARDRLEARDELRTSETRFVDHLVAEVGRIIDTAASTWSGSALLELLSLYDHIAAAVRWCVAHDTGPDRALLLTAVLWAVANHAHTEEIAELADQVLARWDDPSQPMWADAVATAATARYIIGDHEPAVAMAERALEAAEASPYAPATLRRAIAQSARAQGDVERAAEWFVDAAAAARRLGLSAMAIEADLAFAHGEADLGRLTGALDLVQAAAAAAHDAASPLAAAWAHTIEGSIMLRVDAARARPLIEAALAECRTVDHVAGVSVNLRSMAQAELCAGDHPAAAARVLDLLDDLLGRGSTYELRLVLDIAAPLLARAGRLDVAADLAATARSLPVVSVTASVGHELFPLDVTGGQVLSGREAILVTRAELRALREEPGDDAVADRTPASAAGVFRLVGELWEVGWAGETATMKDSKGMGDLARLIDEPGRELHCLELIGGGVVEGDTGPVLDDTARQHYERRVRELQSELDDAEADHDRGRAEQARAELDALVDELTAALGLGGRARKQGGAAERARSTVTQRVRATIRRIDAAQPRLGRHLQRSIRTGVFCSYEPEEPVRWQRT